MRLRVRMPPAMVPFLSVAGIGETGLAAEGFRCTDSKLCSSWRSRFPSARALRSRALLLRPTRFCTVSDHQKSLFSELRSNPHNIICAEGAIIRPIISSVVM